MMTWPPFSLGGPIELVPMGIAGLIDVLMVVVWIIGIFVLVAVAVRSDGISLG